MLRVKQASHTVRACFTPIYIYTNRLSGGLHESLDYPGPPASGKYLRTFLLSLLLAQSPRLCTIWLKEFVLGLTSMYRCLDVNMLLVAPEVPITPSPVTQGAAPSVHCAP
jgi:hypothetical protein